MGGIVVWATATGTILTATITAVAAMLADIDWQGIAATIAALTGLLAAIYSFRAHGVKQDVVAVKEDVHKV